MRKNRKTTEQIFDDLCGQNTCLKSSNTIRKESDICPWNLYTIQSDSHTYLSTKTNTKHNKSLSCVNTPRLNKSKNENHIFSLTYQNLSQTKVSKNSSNLFFRKSTFSNNKQKTYSQKSPVTSTLLNFCLKSIPSIHQFNQKRRQRLNSNLLSFKNKNKDQSQNNPQTSSRMLIRGRKLKRRQKAIQVSTMNLQIHVQ